MKTVADALGVSRSNLIEQLRPEVAPPPPSPPNDGELLERIRRVTDERGSYGYRRVTALVNRQLDSDCKPRVNHKRMYRVMRDHQLLLHRRTGYKPTRTHDGQIITLKSNLRWCSDSFEIRCWNGEVVRVVFSLDCCDRECMRWRATVDAGITGELVRDLMVDTVEYRFGEGAQKVAHPVEWLSDNGPCYTAHETVRFGSSLGLLVCTTPAYSPESNGMAEALVKTLRRDYLHVLDVLWTRHSAPLGMLVRYADDFVVMCNSKSKCEQAEARIQVILARLGLELHPEKTRRVELLDGKEGFDFLGCHLHKRMSGRIWEQEGKRLYFLHRWPSQRSMQRIRQRVKDLTPRRRCHEDLRVVIADLNPVLRGWGEYFRTGNAAKRFKQLDTYVYERLRALRVQRKGRNLRAGEASRWTRESFGNLGLHRLRGTVCYPEAA